MWEDQVSLFELAVSKYGTVDVVVSERVTLQYVFERLADTAQIPNAGVTEMGTFDQLYFKDGKPQPPKLTTLSVNLTGVLYSM